MARLPHARLRPDCVGATAVEFALLLPVMLMLLSGMLEFGRAMWIRQDMQFAVEEAVRYALAEDTSSANAISARASALMAAVGPATAITVTTTLAADSVTVVASVDFAPVLSGLLPPGAITLSARARMPR